MASTAKGTSPSALNRLRRSQYVCATRSPDGPVLPFARAFHQLRAKTTLGSYLDCRRSRPDLSDQLQEQADIALRQFCQEGSMKWVSLLMWAGANPRSRGPALDDVEHIDDADWHTTAMHEACASGNVDVLKRLKPNPTDDLAGMLERAAFFAHRDVLAYLFDLGANPNDRPDGGSCALEACIRHLGWEDFDRIRYSYGANYKTPWYKLSKGREAITLLLKHGAMWKPEPSTLNDTRRILYRIEPEVTVELIGLLLNHENGEDAIRELLRVPRMQQHVASCEGQLSRLGITLDGRRRSDVRATPAPSPYVLAQYDRERLYEEVWSERRRRWRGSTGFPMWLCRRSAGSFRFRSPREGTGRRSKPVGQFHVVLNWSRYPTIRPYRTSTA